MWGLRGLYNKDKDGGVYMGFPISQNFRIGWTSGSRAEGLGIVPGCGDPCKRVGPILRSSTFSISVSMLYAQVIGPSLLEQEDFQKHVPRRFVSWDPILHRP